MNAQSTTAPITLKKTRGAPASTIPPAPVYQMSGAQQGRGKINAQRPIPLHHKAYLISQEFSDQDREKQGVKRTMVRLWDFTDK